MQKQRYVLVNDCNSKQLIIWGHKVLINVQSGAKHVDDTINYNDRPDIFDWTLEVVNKIKAINLLRTTS